MKLTMNSSNKLHDAQGLSSFSHLDPVGTSPACITFTRLIQFEKVVPSRPHVGERAVTYRKQENKWQAFYTNFNFVVIGMFDRKRHAVRAALHFEETSDQQPKQSDVSGRAIRRNPGRDSGRAAPGRHQALDMPRGQGGRHASTEVDQAAGEAQAASEKEVH